MTLSADQLASLTPAQRAVLSLRLRERQAAEGRIPRQSGVSPELSFAQQRLWFIEQLEGSASASAYHISAAVRVEGPLDVDALGAALSAVLARHEVLRTSCRAEQGRPAALLNPAGPVTIEVIDLQRHPAEDRLVEAALVVAAEVGRPIDVASEPLLRASLLRLSGQDHILVLVVHHIASDAWSIGVLCREIETFYAAFRRGDASPLPPLPIQYADFAAWQRQLLSGPRFAPQLDWWKRRLEGAPLLELPFDRPRGAVASARGGRERRDISVDALNALQRFSQERGVTLFTTLLAAYNVLLSRWSRQIDVAIGTPVAGRNSREVEGLIGLFINTLVLRSDLSGNPAFTEVLARVRTTITGALENQDVPFDRLVDELQIERTLSHAPLVSVVFGFQNVPPATLALDGAQVSPFGYERSTTRFDLSLLATESPDGLHLSIEYSADLFDVQTIRRLLDGYDSLLAAVVRDPGIRLNDVPIIADTERTRIVAGFNRTVRAFPHQRTVVDLVSAHAAARPESIAVVDGRGHLTYAGLERRAGRLASHLVARGVGPETIVGILCERGVSFVVSALAVLKAGGAYASIDPRTPPARLERILRRAGIALVLTEDNSLPFESSLAATRLSLAEIEPALEGAAPQSVPVHVDLDGLAYVVHTSGSTGEPNGVAISHRSLLNLVHWHDRVYAITASDAGAQVASVGFDASVWEIWPYLAAGAALHVPDAETRDVPERLWAWIAQAGITTMFLPTPLAEAAILHPVPPGVALRALLTGGDRLHQSPGGLPFDLVNHYGPTESTVVTTAAVVTPTAGAAPPIGQPIDNTQVYVLEPGGSPAPVGVYGELHIGGAGLARGYIGNPRLTAERFVPDAISGAAGARLYRTGDLVRFLGDGALEFLGRRDHQVKIRGYRIELGEIESALVRHPHVSAVAAAAMESDRGPTLVGYVVNGEGGVADDDALRVWLRQSLPEYMVPAVFVRLDSLPLTSNGKVDRSALPKPVIASAEVFIGPRNEAEEIVAQVCGELLGLERVGMQDGFFDLGGHSLLATQFAFRLKQIFEVDVPVRMVFESRTLADLSDAIAERLIDEAPA